MSDRPENDLLRSNVNIRRLEQVVNAGIYTGSLTDKTERWSQGLRNILEIEKELVTENHNTLLKYVDAEDTDQLREIFFNHFKSGTDFETEFSLITANNSHKRIHIHHFFHRDPNQHYTGIVKDITEVYKIKHALEEKIRQLDKSNANLQEFVYVASHDLQEPVRKIATFAGRISSQFGKQLGDEGNMYLGRLEKAVTHMQALLDDLLSFSRLSYNDKPHSKVPLTECLSKAISELDIKIEESGAKIGATELPVVEGYYLQLKQLFSNLISNAIKFAKPGIVPEININTARVNPYAYPNIPLLRHTHYTKIEVCDNGIGFEQEFAERIFQIFQRLNSKAEYSGSGVGLSICRKIAENHNGYIFAESRPGSGSCFTILLPYTQP